MVQTVLAALDTQNNNQFNFLKMKNLILIIFILAFNDICYSQLCEPNLNNCSEKTFNLQNGGVLKALYCGEINDRNESDGCGLLTYYDFDIEYEKGIFKNGFLVQGERKFIEGPIYKGVFENDNIISGTLFFNDENGTLNYEGGFNKGDFQGNGKLITENQYEIITKEGRFFAGELFDGRIEERNKNNGIIIRSKLTDGKSEVIFRNDINRKDSKDIIGDNDFTEINLIQRGSIEDNRLAYDVKLEINGVECEFLLDSGAMSFTVGKLMYERLKNAGVKYTDLNNIESVIGVGGQALTNTVIFDEIKIGDYIIKNVVAKVMLEDNSSLLGTGFLLKFSDVIWKMNDNKLILYK